MSFQEETPSHSGPHWSETSPLQDDGTVSTSDSEVAKDGLQYALDKIWNNGWTYRVAARRQQLDRMRRERIGLLRDETTERLSKFPITPINELVKELDPSGAGAIPSGTHNYFDMQTDEDWMGLIDFMQQQQPDKYTETHISNVGYTAMVRMLGWHNLDEPREEQVSARSLLGSYKDQPKVPLTMFGVSIPLLGIRSSPPYMRDPRTVATALTVDTELRGAGLLMQRGRRGQRLEAQTHLELMPPSKSAPRWYNPLHREKPDSYWDEIRDNVAHGNKSNDVIALRLVLDALHPDYYRYAMGWETAHSVTKWAHKYHLHTKIGSEAVQAILDYGRTKARLSGNPSTFPWARSIAEANLRLLEGDAESTTESGRRISEYRDRRLLRVVRGSLPPAKQVPHPVSATVSFCNRRYLDTWQPRAKIERRRSRRDLLISLIEMTADPTL